MLTGYLTTVERRLGKQNCYQQRGKGIQQGGAMGNVNIIRRFKLRAVHHAVIFPRAGDEGSHEKDACTGNSDNWGGLIYYFSHWFSPDRLVIGR